MYISKVRCKRCVGVGGCFSLVFFYAVFLVDISAFKYNGFIFDVRHEDVADIQSFNLSAASYAALEAQTC